MQPCQTKVMSDGGMDFSPLCEQQGCTFKLCPPANDRDFSCKSPSVRVIAATCRRAPVRCGFSNCGEVLVLLDVFLKS